MVSAMLGAIAALMRCHRVGEGASGLAASLASASGESDVLSEARSAAQSILRASVGVSPTTIASRTWKAVTIGQARYASASGAIRAMIFSDTRMALPCRSGPWAEDVTSRLGQSRGLPRQIFSLR